MLERAVAATNGAVELAKVNVDDNPRVAQSFGAQVHPAVFAIRDGKIADQFIGALPEQQVAAFVQKLVPALSEADTLVAAGDELSLLRALELEPGHQAATEALARILSTGATRPTHWHSWHGCPRRPPAAPWPLKPAWSRAECTSQRQTTPKLKRA